MRDVEQKDFLRMGVRGKETSWGWQRRRRQLSPLSPRGTGRGGGNGEPGRSTGAAASRGRRGSLPGLPRVGPGLVPATSTRTNAEALAKQSAGDVAARRTGSTWPGPAQRARAGQLLRRKSPRPRRQVLDVRSVQLFSKTHTYGLHFTSKYSTTPNTPFLGL